MTRVRIITGLVACAFVAIWIRLFYWQVLSYSTLKDLADEQHYHQLEIPPSRGEILSADKTPLVTNQTAYLVFVEKKHVSDASEYARKLAPILAEDVASISARLASHDVWVPLKHQVEADKVDLLKELELLGIGFEREDKRFYPEGSMSAHLVGFVGKDEIGRPLGYFGLEGYYNKELSGQPGFLLQERDAFGDPIVIGKTERIEPKHGRSIVLHIDKTMQFIAESKLLAAIDRYDAKGGTVTILDPKTGGIQALASFPNYDPIQFSEFPDEYYRNPVIADTYEPGSTFKPLIVAKALDDEAIDVDYTYDERGPLTITNYQINTATNEYHGEIDLAEILKYSSNVAMVDIAQRLQKESLLEFLEQFGLGSDTDVDLQEEAGTVLKSDSEWRDIDIATVSFGQGIAVTRLQLLRAIGAIANDGVMMQPRIVKEIIDADGTSIPIPPTKERQLFTPKTAKVMRSLMAETIDNGPSYWKVPEHFKIAGKTGTAQIPVEGYYDEEKTIASFVGFGPAQDPAFVMLVTINEPQSSPWGSATAAPTFFEIADELFTYLGIYPV